MSTARSPTNKDCTADLGAQYITATPFYAQAHKKHYDDLLAAKLLLPLDSDQIEGLRPREGCLDYATPEGVSSIVRHYFNQCKVLPQFGQHVTGIELSSDRDGWIVSANQKSESFGATVLTMPVPQIVQLAGINEILEKDTLEKLNQVEYSCRYAMALFYNDHQPDVALNAQKSCAKYMTDHPVFCYAASKSNGPTSVTFHTSVPFGIKHMEEESLETMEEKLKGHIFDLYPDWPRPDSVKCQKWRYSQVLKPYQSSPGAIVLKEKPLLIAAGDGFAARSGFDACLDSAHKVLDLIKQYY